MQQYKIDDILQRCIKNVEVENLNYVYSEEHSKGTSKNIP